MAEPGRDRTAAELKGTARAGVRLRRRAGVAATIERHPDFFPIYTDGGHWKHARRALDRLVRGLPRRHDVADRRAHRRSLVAADGRALLAADRAQAARPRRPRPRLHLPQYLSPLVRADRRRAAPPGADHGRPDAGLAVQSSGAVPPLVRRAREPVHRHHDERADHLLRRARDRRPRPVRPGRRPLPDHRADARPPRRLDGARGDLRPRDRRVPAADDPSGPAAPIRPGRAGWPGRSTASARSSLTRTTRPTSRSPSATPTTSSPAARAIWSLPGISTSRRVPTGSTTARPPRSPHRASGTSPRSPPERSRPAPTATATPRSPSSTRSAPTDTWPGRHPAGKACSSTASITSTRSWASTSR